MRWTALVMPCEPVNGVSRRGPVESDVLADKSLALPETGEFNKFYLKQAVKGIFWRTILLPEFASRSP